MKKRKRQRDHVMFILCAPWLVICIQKQRWGVTAGCVWWKLMIHGISTCSDDVDGGVTELRRESEVWGNFKECVVVKTTSASKKSLSPWSSISFSDYGLIISFNKEEGNILKYSILSMTESFARFWMIFWKMYIAGELLYLYQASFNKIGIFNM